MEARRKHYSESFSIFVEFLAQVGFSIQIQFIKFIQKEQHLCLDKLRHVQGSLLWFGQKILPVTVLTLAKDILRFLGHSLTPFGHDTAASVTGQKKKA